jgi:hypothetical protein
MAAKTVDPRPVRTLDELGIKVLPAGKYALRHRETRKVHFFSVEYGKNGTRWQGYTFVTEHLGPNRRQVRDPQERNGVLAGIKRDPLGALKLFAQETGQCSYCGLELTNERSRMNGYGEKCAKDRGLPW